MKTGREKKSEHELLVKYGVELTWNECLQGDLNALLLDEDRLGRCDAARAGKAVRQRDGHLHSHLPDSQPITYESYC